jgi:xylose isomerase
LKRDPAPSPFRARVTAPASAPRRPSRPPFFPLWNLQTEHFPGIGKIKYEGPTSNVSHALKRREVSARAEVFTSPPRPFPPPSPQNNLAFRHYNPKEVVGGRVSPRIAEARAAGARARGEATGSPPQAGARAFTREGRPLPRDGVCPPFPLRRPSHPLCPPLPPLPPSPPQTMEDWCRFSVCYWHTFRGLGADPFGGQTLFRTWDDGSNSVDNALRRVDAAFEFFTKLGAPFYTFHDVDVSPQGETLAQSNKNFDAVADYLQKKQTETGIKLLWGTANLFSHWRYAQGASTNPDAHVFAYAGAQVKKAMEVTHRLGGENYVFWGGREGYQSILNTNVRRELDHLARFLHMAVEHKKSLGATYQLLIEPKPREPTKHQVR